MCNFIWRFQSLLSSLYVYRYTYLEFLYHEPLFYSLSYSIYVLYYVILNKVFMFHWCIMCKTFLCIFVFLCVKWVLQTETPTPFLSLLVIPSCHLMSFHLISLVFSQVAFYYHIPHLIPPFTPLSSPSLLSSRISSLPLSSHISSSLTFLSLFFPLPLSFPLLYSPSFPPFPSPSLPSCSLPLPSLPFSSSFLFSPPFVLQLSYGKGPYYNDYGMLNSLY